MDLNTFKNIHQPKTLARDKIEAHQLSVFELRSEGYSYSSIKTWLASQHVTVSERTVGRYFNKHKASYSSFLKTVNKPETKDSHEQ
ncbi:hypothetical protein DS885_03910 [Psychromonas sp. B3M02]|uniref:hypothetical protein n=1 Tax=Psychromonas sp. B3M02 TaxID=2267226 RepID=UPI000DEA634C|nr:hypothetical protein [Psychromonas sp. B3M02]RBW47302.1 hypothetical protein DS885_03910 [Psychromonas sp. B3M02]